MGCSTGLHWLNVKLCTVYALVGTVATYKSSVLTNMLFFGAFACKFQGKMVPVTSVLWLWKIMFTPKYNLYELIMGKQSGCSSLQTTKSNIIVILLMGELCFPTVQKEATTMSFFSLPASTTHLLVTPFSLQSTNKNYVGDYYLGVFHLDMPNLAFIG